MEITMENDVICFFQKIPGNKFNFNEFFSQAWLKSPNLIAGFRTCDIYPLNCEALKAVPTCSSNNKDEKIVDSTATTSNVSPEIILLKQEMINQPLQNLWKYLM